MRRLQGSISTDATVSGIIIKDNKIIDKCVLLPLLIVERRGADGVYSDQALRIKTKSDATDASVAGVTYSGNTATGCNRFGVIIDQSYPSTIGTPGTGVIISGVNFVGTTNTIAVDSTAQRVAVNCGTGSCTGALSCVR